MQATRFSLFATLTMIFIAANASVHAGYPVVPAAPSAYGPGYYCVGYCGGIYGPNYHLRPAHPPFNGMVFPPKAPAYPGYGSPYGHGYGGGAGGAGAVTGPPPVFPTHPFARSPRDYFMEER